MSGDMQGSLKILSEHAGYRSAYVEVRACQPLQRMLFLVQG